MWAEAAVSGYSAVLGWARGDREKPNPGPRSRQISYLKRELPRNVQRAGNFCSYELFRP